MPGKSNTVLPSIFFPVPDSLSKKRRIIQLALGRYPCFPIIQIAAPTLP